MKWMHECQLCHVKCLNPTQFLTAIKSLITSALQHKNGHINLFLLPKRIFLYKLDTWACGPVGRALDSRLEGFGVQFPVLAMCRSVSGKLCIPHCLGLPGRNGHLVHRSKVGSIVAGCIGAHLTRGKVKSVEHDVSWSLGSKQLPLPLYLAQSSYRSGKSFW